MNAPASVADPLARHVRLEVECIDRLYLNVYQPRLQHERGIAAFFRYHCGYRYPSSALMDPISKRFWGAVQTFIRERRLPLVVFKTRQRKGQVARQYRSRFREIEGLLFVGRALEKTRVFRTEKHRDPRTGLSYPRIIRSTAVVDHLYFYGLDEDFGPFFLKFCTYFPYNAKLCINGHEYVKRQLAKEGIAYEALDNGIRRCANPQRLQQLSNGLSAGKIEAVLRKWLRRLPHPFTASDCLAGYHYEISILQAEFSLTQVLDRPLAGRVFFEQVIRENLDLGRPDYVQLIFARRVTRQTPGRRRTRVLTEGVLPSLHIDYKRSRIKQYLKEGVALRTETIVNNPLDFGVGKRLHNLPNLREIAFQANRRLLHIERVSQDCTIGEERFRRLQDPAIRRKQRSGALSFADATVQALFRALVRFRLAPNGFSCGELRECWAPLTGRSAHTVRQGEMTYHLRRLRMHGLIERVPGTHRYRVTIAGWRTAFFCIRVYTRIFAPGFAEIVPGVASADSRLRREFERLEKSLDRWMAEQNCPCQT